MEAPDTGGQQEDPSTAAFISVTRARGRADQERCAGHERGSRGKALRHNSSIKDYD